MAPLTLYTPIFAYGSNLWIEQFKSECPDNVFSCVAKLDGWKWIINKKGYTNIIPSPNDYVWGTVLLLHAHDERNLDDTEGDEYVKSIRPVQAVDMKLKPDPSIVVYFDKDYTTPGRPLPSFVRTLEKAMEDGKKRGIPQSYFDKYWKPFLTNPYVGTETAEAE